MEFFVDILKDGFAKASINVESGGFFDDFTGPTVEFRVNDGISKWSFQIMNSNADSSNGVMNVKEAIKTTQEKLVKIMEKIFIDNKMRVSISGDPIEGSTHINIEKDSRYYICYVDDRK